MSVGLDIGSRSIKVVELINEGGRPALKSAGAIGYSGDPPDKLEDEKALAAIANIIKKLFHDAKITSKEVAVSIPDSLAFSRVLKFPLLNDQEIASAVKWEAEEYIPIPINEAVVEHQILERLEVGNPPQVLVLLIAVQRSLIEKYVKLLALAGLHASGVETELISLARSVGPTDTTAIVVDFGARSTDIGIIKQGQLVLARSMAMAGDAFTRAVAQAMGVQDSQAEEYKRSYGLDPAALEGKVGRALSPTFKVVIEEIKKAVHFYELDSRGDKPSSLVLTGGTAGLPGVIPAFANSLGLEVTMGDPFRNIKVDAPAMKSLSGYQPLYPVSVGLALRGS
jgi:type IV pilus assembly protein PilM